MLGSLTSLQAEPTPEIVKQTLVNAMWQDTSEPSMTPWISFAAVGALGLIIMILNRRAKESDPFGIGIALLLVCGVLSGIGFWGVQYTNTKTQAKFEERATKLTRLLFNPTVQISSATQTKEGLTLALFTPGESSSENQVILGKLVPVTTIEAPAERETLTAPMLANLAPLNIKIAGQPLNNAVAQAN